MKVFGLGSDGACWIQHQGKVSIKNFKRISMFHSTPFSPHRLNLKQSELREAQETEIFWHACYIRQKNVSKMLKRRNFFLVGFYAHTKFKPKAD